MRKQSLSDCCKYTLEVKLLAHQGYFKNMEDLKISNGYVHSLRKRSYKIILSIIQAKPEFELSGLLKIFTLLITANKNAITLG